MSVLTADQATARLRERGVVGPLTPKFVEDCRQSFEFFDLLRTIEAEPLLRMQLHREIIALGIVDDPWPAAIHELREAECALAGAEETLTESGHVVLGQRELVAAERAAFERLLKLPCRNVHDVLLKIEAITDHREGFPDLAKLIGAVTAEARTMIKGELA